MQTPRLLSVQINECMSAGEVWKSDKPQQPGCNGANSLPSLALPGMRRQHCWQCLHDSVVQTTMIVTGMISIAVMPS